jgi:hypothetical protein
MAMSSVARLYRFYHQGFRSMTLGKTLWKIILIKLIILFAVLKLFFFQDFLQSNFSTDQERADHVLKQITGAAGNTPSFNTDHNIGMTDRHKEQ